MLQTVFVEIISSNNYHKVNTIDQTKVDKNNTIVKPIIKLFSSRKVVTLIIFFPDKSSIIIREVFFLNKLHSVSNCGLIHLLNNACHSLCHIVYFMRTIHFIFSVLNRKYFIYWCFKVRSHIQSFLPQIQTDTQLTTVDRTSWFLEKNIFLIFNFKQAFIFSHLQVRLYFLGDTQQ